MQRRLHEGGRCINLSWKRGWQVAEWWGRVHRWGGTSVTGRQEWAWSGEMGEPTWEAGVGLSVLNLRISGSQGEKLGKRQGWWHGFYLACVNLIWGFKFQVEAQGQPDPSIKYVFWNSASYLQLGISRGGVGGSQGWAWRSEVAGAQSCNALQKVLDVQEAWRSTDQSAWPPGQLISALVAQDNLGKPKRHKAAR